MWMLFFLSALLGVMGSEDGPPEVARRLQALHCPPCEQVHCSSRRVLKLQCKGGVTTGVCGCCPVCARVEGETCGGMWDYLGKCDKGLVCVYQDSEESQDLEHKGICKTGKMTDLTFLIMDISWISVLEYRQPLPILLFKSLVSTTTITIAL